MLILKYFLVVGAALTVGLLALNAHLTSSVSVAPAPVRAATTTAPPPVADPEPVTAAAPAAPPAAPAKAASHTRRSKAAKRHSGVTAR
jgi:hypothetical protein